MGDFEGRIALVTGGARGIGGGIAAALAAQGATIVVTDVLDTEGSALADSLSSAGKAEFRHLDVRSEEQWREVAEGIRERHGHLDVVVNAAGILVPGGVEDTSYEQYKKVMDISADGTFLMLKHCLPLLKEIPGDRYAAVVNVSSIAAFDGAPAAFSYAASRAAMLSMTKSVAVEWARAGYRIRVNSVHPGSVVTDLSNITYDKLTEQGMTREQAVAYMTGLHPLGRLGDVDDIAEAVLYLASDRASWVTGTSLVVDGGRIA